MRAIKNQVMNFYLYIHTFLSPKEKQVFFSAMIYCVMCKNDSEQCFRLTCPPVTNKAVYLSIIYLEKEKVDVLWFTAIIRSFAMKLMVLPKASLFLCW